MNQFSLHYCPPHIKWAIHMLGEGIQLPFGDQAWLSMARQQQTTWWSCCLVFSNPWNIFASRDRHPKIKTYLKQPTSKTQNAKLVSLVCETFDTTYYKNDWHWNHWTFKLVWTISKPRTTSANMFGQVLPLVALRGTLPLVNVCEWWNQKILPSLDG